MVLRYLSTADWLTTAKLSETYSSILLVSKNLMRCESELGMFPKKDNHGHGLHSCKWFLILHSLNHQNGKPYEFIVYSKQLSIFN